LFSSAGWYAALKRVKGLLLSRTIPLISVFAAFSFVVMMFNLPLPGGTTGHAVGIAVAAIVLGPWASALAISIALTLQALFFGDGGITTLGANCFNMAIAGSFVAYWTYKLLSGGVNASTRRRVLSAGIAGYLSINVAALLTAIEFGIQPLLFHDPSGAPLYAPYGLRVAIPAMMIGHLTFAGIAEAILSAGMISYLQTSDIRLLRGTAGELAYAPSSQPSSRNLWATIVLLLLMTPLGILTAGKAWGEWSPSDLAARNNAMSPPAGMERLATFWTAPFPDYAPGFIKSPHLGYLLSGMFAVGFLGAVALLASVVGRRLFRKELRS
jgi:cobalt/nickel transport system permease protein